MPLQWQKLEVPLASGLNTKVDERALEPPSLSIAKNVQFTELGGLQKRHPYTSLGTDTLDGGSISDPRRLAVYEDELLLFTKSKLYSYSETDSAWVERAEYLAPHVTERSRFVRTTEQIDCDRAELDGVAVFVWQEGTEVYGGAIDTGSGAVLFGPEAVTLTSRSLPRLIALNTRILLFFRDAGGGRTDLDARSIDPSNLSGTFAQSAGSTTVSSSASGPYDIAKLDADTAIVALLNSSSGDIDRHDVDEDGTVASSSTGISAADTGIAVDVSPAGDIVYAFADGTDIQAFLDPASGGVQTKTLGSVGSGDLDQITCAFRSTQDSSEYRCYVFWSENETDASSSFATDFNYVDSGGTTGTAAELVHRLGVASHAFDYDGRVFVWLAFSGASVGVARVHVQNVYLLYRDDGELIATSAPRVAGGFAQTTGHLPGVQNTGGNVYTWCGIERQRIVIGNDGDAYEARAPREIALELDSDAARRTAQLGRTLYISGSPIMQYDGEGLSEVGFIVFPWEFGAADTGTGSIEEGTYTYKLSWKWNNAKGEVDRSATSANFSVAVTGSSEVGFGSSIVPLHSTRKTGDRSEAAVEVWRTLVDPVFASPFYLTTSKDPSATGDNGYVENDPTTSFLDFTDNLSDASLDDRATNPESGGVLENIAPPPASIILAGSDRLYLAGVSDDPHAVWYSKLRNEGEVAAFHETLRVKLPTDGGDITALAHLNETLVAFKEHAIYLLPGDGPDNTGDGQNLGPAQLVSRDVGATSHDAVAVTPEGIVFKSAKGWFQLDRGFSVRYIGGPIEDFDGDTFVAVHALEDQHQIRCLSGSRALVYDTVAQQWSEWELSGGLDAVIWGGIYHYLDSTTARAEASDYSGVDYSMDVETAWIKLNDLQGFGRVRQIMALGEYRSAHDLRIRLARDYDDSSYFDDKTWTVSPTTVGGPEQVRHGPSIQKVEAVKVRITDTAVGGGDPSGESLKLTGLAFQVGRKPGLMRLPAGQKQ